MKINKVLLPGVLFGLALLAGCDQAGAPTISAKKPLESPASLSSWPNKTQVIGLTFRQPLTLEQASDKLSLFGKAFHAGFFVIGEGGGAFRAKSAVSIGKVRTEVLRVAEHLAYVKPRHDCEIAARLVEKYKLQSYTRAQALKMFTRDQRLQNLAKSIIASENTRKYALGVIEGSMPTLYAVILRAKPNRISNSLNGLIQGVAQISASGSFATFHSPKPDTVESMVLHARATHLTDPNVLFDEAMWILRKNCKIRLFQ